ncbi:MAG: alpha/beta fold hydrolase [Actinomycetota bacterium]
MGTGSPVVLVPGAWNWAEHWLGVAEALADSHTCSVMDRRGRGTSGDGDVYAFDREIEDIAAVLEAAGSDASLLGHSSGAIYALETARRVPVERLIVYEPPLRWAERGDPAGMVDRVRALVEDGRFEDAAELFFREKGRQNDEGIAFLKTLPLWDRMVELAPICVREWDEIIRAQLSVDGYRKMSAPTLLLAGSENLDHPSMATEALSMTLPNVHTEVFDGHAHTAHAADPALVADTVRTFLAASPA